jgi:RimJ/RimL family protein N-acetyltransferase
MAMRYNIRPAQPSDRDAVIALTPRLEAFGPPANVVPGEVGAGEAKALESVFARMPEGAALLVADAGDGRIAGFVFLETKVDYFTQRPHGHVGILVVAHEFEGQGIGRMLLDTADAWALALGYERLTLFVFEGNERARATYQRAGYRADLVRYRRDLVAVRPLQTERLVLAPITEALISAEMDGTETLQRALNGVVPGEWPIAGRDHAFAERCKARARDGMERMWPSYYLTTRSDPQKTLIGVAAFEGAPDDRASVQVSVEVLPSWRRRGFGSEAMRALLTRAFAVSTVRSTTAEATDDNLAGLALLKRFHFRPTTERSGSAGRRFELSRDTFAHGAEA